jgi:hypothetical protein
MQLDNLITQRDRIQLLLGKKQIITGRANFSKTIAKLEEGRLNSEARAGFER